MSGYSASMQSIQEFSQAPFALSLLQAYLCTRAIRLLGYLLLAALTWVASVFVKKFFPVFFVLKRRPAWHFCKNCLRFPFLVVIASSCMSLSYSWVNRTNYTDFQELSSRIREAEKERMSIYAQLRSDSTEQDSTKTKERLRECKKILDHFQKFPLFGTNM